MQLARECRQRQRYRVRKSLYDIVGEEGRQATECLNQILTNNFELCKKILLKK
jgi:hypothetical protein